MPAKVIRYLGDPEEAGAPDSKPDGKASDDGGLGRGTNSVQEGKVIGDELSSGTKVLE